MGVAGHSGRARGKGVENGREVGSLSTFLKCRLHSWSTTGTMDRASFSQMSNSIHFWAHKPALSLLLDSYEVSSISHCYV